jgi:hypothetical protein
MEFVLDLLRLVILLSFSLAFSLLVAGPGDARMIHVCRRSKHHPSRTARLVRAIGA